MSFNSPNIRYSPLSWTTGYRASRPFEPLLHNPSYIPVLRPFPPPPVPPTPYYLTQLHLSRPPTIPDPFPHPTPTPRSSPLRSLLFFLAPYSYFQPFYNAILNLWSTITLLAFHILATIRPYCRAVFRRIQEVDWTALFIAFVVFFFLPRGPYRGDGEENGEGMGIGLGNGDVEIVLEPAYVIAVRNCRSMRGLLGAGGKGELLVV